MSISNLFIRNIKDILHLLTGTTKAWISLLGDGGGSACLVRSPTAKDLKVIRKNKLARIFLIPQGEKKFHFAYRDNDGNYRQQEIFDQNLTQQLSELLASNTTNDYWINIFFGDKNTAQLVTDINNHLDVNESKHIICEAKANKALFIALMLPMFFLVMLVVFTLPFIAGIKTLVNWMKIPWSTDIEAKSAVSKITTMKAMHILSFQEKIKDTYQPSCTSSDSSIKMLGRLKANSDVDQIRKNLIHYVGEKQANGKHNGKRLFRDIVQLATCDSFSAVTSEMKA